MKTIYTIGLTRKTLQEFIGWLRVAGVHEVIDRRLRNTSQLAWRGTRLTTLGTLETVL